VQPFDKVATMSLPALEGKIMSSGQGSRTNAEVLFLGICAALAVLAVILMILNAEDFAPLIQAVQDQLELWQQEFDQMIEELQQMEPEREP